MRQSPSGFVQQRNGDPPRTASLVGSFEVYTDQWVLELDVADLVPGGALFGSLELFIDSDGGGGHVTVEIGAEGVYSVGFPGVCQLNSNSA